MNLLHLLQQRFAVALTGLVTEPGPASAAVKATQDPKHGDYQFNGAMSLAKALGRPKENRAVAEEIIKRLPPDDLFEKVEIAGPGFINLTFRTEWLAQQMGQLAKGDRLGIAPAEKPRTFVIDYSSPNVAKPLHVGHLRSTIIGDSLKRLLRFLGHTVIADNHLGDWGLQFGMLLYGYKQHMHEDAAFQADPVKELARVYQELRKRIDPAEKVEDDRDLAKNYSPEVLAKSQQVLAACRAETTKLHAGDPENRKLWQMFMPWCLAEIKDIYNRLDIHFDETLGESFYNPMLADVVADLRKKGIAHDSKGALAIFFTEQGDVADGPPPEPDPNAKPDEKKKGPAPAVIQSSHGAFTYTTTDLATIRYRMDHWHPSAILYVVDFRQKLHFKNVYAAARKWGYDQTELQHISFGSVLGPNGKPISTTKGDGALLEELLAEAIRAAAQKYDELCKEQAAIGEEVTKLSPEELRQIHEAVGYGAVKYADLSQNRESDYTFDPEKMVRTDGNTATYMQYAYARCRAIFRKGDENADLYRTHPPPVYLETPYERALALQLLRFEETLHAAAAEYRPSLITAYLWDLCKTYSAFYLHCPVLHASTTPALRQSRLLLCDLTARTIQKGLDLLGIRTIERM
jgi:arginyl-tRNA synthetase